MVSCLLDYGAKIDVTTQAEDGWSKTPLDVAKGKVVIEVLTAARAGGVKIQEQHTFLNHACHGRWENVKRILAESPGLVNVQDAISKEARKRWSALHHAAKRGNVEMVSFLLNHGAATDVTTDERDGPRRTPLDVATSEGVINLLSSAR